MALSDDLMLWQLKSAPDGVAPQSLQHGGVISFSECRATTDLFLFMAALMETYHAFYCLYMFLFM